MTTPLSSANFLVAVTALIKVGRAFREYYRERLRAQPISVLIPAIGTVTNADVVGLGLEKIFADPSLNGPGCEFGDIFAPNAAHVGDFAPGLTVERRAELLRRAAEIWGAGVGQGPESAGEIALPLASVRTVKAWVDPEFPTSRHARLGLAIVDAALEVIAQSPQLTGLEGRTQRIVAGLAENLSGILDDDFLDGPNAPQSFGERAFKIFFDAALETAAEHPEFIAPKPHIAALVGAVLKPLHEEVRQDPSRSLPALNRLEQLARSSMLQGLMGALSTHSDAFLKGEFKAGTAPGAVARAVLGEYVRVDHDRFDLNRLFSAEHMGLILKAGLATAKDRPELFIRGDGEDDANARQYLTKIAEVMENAPFPYDWRGGLAAELANVGFEVAAAYARRRFVTATGDSAWSQAGMAVVQHIFFQVFDGFKAGLISGDRQANPFERLFDRTQAVEILKILATHIAETPGMVVDDNVRAEARNLAVGIARFISADTTGLLTANDWRGVVGKALELAASNPGALFKIDPADTPESHVAVKLIQTLLTRAAGQARTEQRAQGSLLFGETLGQMISATLEAASNQALAVLEPAAQEAHVKAVDAFIERLVQAAKGEDRTLKMSASDFVYVYRWYIAYVLDEGPNAEISNEDLRKVLRRVDGGGPREGAQA